MPIIENHSSVFRLLLIIIQLHSIFLCEAHGLDVANFQMMWLIDSASLLDMLSSVYSILGVRGSLVSLHAGCESEVQQQQLSHLAQLLQDKGHALQGQALSHVTTASQPAGRNSASAVSDSMHGTHGSSHNSRDAGADLQVSQASNHPDITDVHHGFDTADMQRRPHTYSGLGQHAADAACMHHAGQVLHTRHPGHGGARGVGLWGPDSGTHYGSGHDCGTQASQLPTGSSHHVVHESASGAHGFQRQANHRSAYSHSNAHVGPSCLGFGAKPRTQHGVQYRQLHHLARAVQQSPQQSRALQPARSPHQANFLNPNQTTGQSRDLQQGLHQAWVPQQDMSSQHHPQPGRSAQQGPQQGRSAQQGPQQGRSAQQDPRQGRSAQQGPQQGGVTSSDPQPQRSSHRLGQKRKQALLASKCVPEDAYQGPAAANADAADAYGHKSGEVCQAQEGELCCPVCNNRCRACMLSCALCVAIAVGACMLSPCLLAASCCTLQHHYALCLPVKIVSKCLLCDRHALAYAHNMTMQLLKHRRLLSSSRKVILHQMHM